MAAVYCLSKSTIKKTDILFLLQFFYPEYISSATLPFDTASRLAEEGLSVDVLCGYPHEYVDEVDIPCRETVNNVNITRVRYLQLDRKKAIGRLVNYLSLTFVMLLRLFKMKDYKTVIVYSNPPILPWVAALASKLFKCRLIFVAYDLYPEIALRTNTVSKDSMITKLMNHINGFVYRQASAVVALSSEMKEFIVNNRNISADRVHVIPNWYKDEYRSDANEDNSFESVTNDRFVVGYFGNMGIAQDMEPIKYAIRFYKNDDKVCFLLSGHGSKHSEIKQLIEEEKIDNVYLYGFLKGRSYYDALHISDCAIVSLEKGLTGLCVPSKTYGYMMHGLPIVAIMEDSDIVTDVLNGAGYHVDGDRTEGLTEVIAEMKNNREECAARGAVSRQLYLKSYTPEICLKKYTELLNEILKKQTDNKN